MGYTSNDSRILETLEDKDGTRKALIQHDLKRGGHEYVVCSNLQTEHFDGALGYEEDRYSWDWGHYFQSIVDAVECWKEKALGKHALEVECAFGTLVADKYGGSEGYDRIEVDLLNDGGSIPLALVGTGPALAETYPAIRVFDEGMGCMHQFGPEVRPGEYDLHVHAYNGNDFPAVSLRLAVGRGKED